ITDTNIFILLLVLITGTLFLVWLADQNTTYGIAGPMPIVLMSLVKSMFNSHFAKLNLNPILLVIIICSLALILFILLFIERSEYRLEYNDIMNISSKDTPT
ncbi:accessory Sec system protein translocase subunit SecY2, partial [Staphylococcus aureus]|nr:accessory Sec system protein translocase subunit SecY2 [Staphylococcus aureus]